MSDDWIPSIRLRPEYKRHGDTTNGRFRFPILHASYHPDVTYMLYDMSGSSNEKAISARITIGANKYLHTWHWLHEGSVMRKALALQPSYLKSVTVGRLLLKHNNER